VARTRALGRDHEPACHDNKITMLAGPGVIVDVASGQVTAGTGMVSLRWSVTRNGLSRLSNRSRSPPVAVRSLPPGDEPGSVVAVLPTLASGGLLWLGVATVLATGPGHTRCVGRDGVVVVALAAAVKRRLPVLIVRCHRCGELCLGRACWVAWWWGFGGHRWGNPSRCTVAGCRGRDSAGDDGNGRGRRW